MSVIRLRLQQQLHKIGVVVNAVDFKKFFINPDGFEAKFLIECNRTVVICSYLERNDSDSLLS